MVLAPDGGVRVVMRQSIDYPGRGIKAPIEIALDHPVAFFM
jgi:hypothetical protein